MYSPYNAVCGHDKTYIQRMTVEEYVKELQEEEADLRGESPSPQQENNGGAGKVSPGSTLPSQMKPRMRQYEQRRSALSFRNPNVTFSSKYPMYDRLGRELCVAYQIQDTSVQQELRRLELEQGNGERNSRRSGVRLSAELPMSSDGTTVRPDSLDETQPPSLTEGLQPVFSEEASRLVPPGYMNGDSFVDIEVSASSHYPSNSASRTFSRPASVRPSEFSIFRDSGAISRGGFGKARSSIPARAIAEEDKILIHREARVGPVRATSAPSFPPAVVHVDGNEDESWRPEWRRRSEKRHRSRSSGGRLSRVRFISEERDENTKDALVSANAKKPSEQQQRRMTRVARGAAPVLSRLHTPPPVPLSSPDHQTRIEGAAVEEATRWTTLSRGSAAVRTTKQLFRSTTHSSNASRMTTTLTYDRPIPSSVYGLTAPAISANKVRDAVEQNVTACAAAMPQHYTQGVGADVNSEGSRRGSTTPELQCGSVVKLGREWYRLVHFHVVAEVYEATRVNAPVAAANQSMSRQSVQATCDDKHHEQIKEATDPSVAAANTVETGSNNVTSLGRKEDGEHVKTSTSPSAPLTSYEGQPPTHLTIDATLSPLPIQQERGQEQEPPQQQCFVYRWRATGQARGVDEARRAALGLSLIAPHTHVTGFHYADGGGITVVTLPAGYHAVPVSALPLSLRSYTTLLRTVLKALSAMVARRTVHGNVAALGDLFLVMPVDNSHRTPERTASPQQDGVADNAEAKSRELFVVMFHWERWVDFGMYVDRNAGRTLPLDFEDNSAQPLVYYSKDLLTGLQLFLEHALAAELTSEQYILLQKLIVLAAEPTSVASHLIQLKNLMLTLPTDTAALEKSFENALLHYTVE